MCCYDETPDFEISIKGHKIVKVADGGVLVDGKNFHADLKDISNIIDVLNDILGSAKEAKKPKLVMNEPIVVTPFKGPWPTKAANNR